MTIGQNHATTKFKWFYMYKNGHESWGAIIVPIGEESVVEEHITKLVKENLEGREEFDKTCLAIIEIGSNKLR